MRQNNQWLVLILVAMTVGLGGALFASCQTTETVHKSSNNSTGESLPDSRGIDSAPKTIGIDANQSRDSELTLPSTDGESSNEASKSEVWSPPEGGFVLRDTQTGSLWNLKGEAFKGPLKGRQLEQIPAFNSFWFAWSVFYHESTIWGRDKPNKTADITDNDSDCLVPCNEIQPNLPKDRIPAFSHDDQGPVPNSELVAADSPSADYLSADSFVFGVVVEGEPRAYSHNVLWHHEIYNDSVDGTDYSVTFCPLTGSGIVFQANHADKVRDFGVSGKLYNSNLVMFDRQSGTEWSQMLGRGVTGPGKGSELERLPVVETTWEKWKKMYPDTLVTPNDLANRNYQRYPYGSYRTNHDNTFQPTNPTPSKMYKNKKRILGLVGEDSAKGYPFPELAKHGDRVVVNDTFEERELVIVYEKQHRTAIPFSRNLDGETLTFEGVESPGADTVE
jgi:hypothetical protein